MALAVKYLFYEDWEENCRIRKTYLEELERRGPPPPPTATDGGRRK